MRMQKMKLIQLILIITCLNACKDPNGYPRIDDQEQLSPNFFYVEINGKEYIDTEKSFCLSRVYRYSKGYIGPISNAIKLPIYECQKVIGKAPSEYGIFATWLESFRKWLLSF